MIRNTLLSLLLFAVLSASSALAIKAVPQPQPADGFYPLLIEYISSYRVKTNDLRDVISNQYASITISRVNTSYATVVNPQFKVNYRNGSASH